MDFTKIFAVYSAVLYAFALYIGLIVGFYYFGIWDYIFTPLGFTN